MARAGTTLSSLPEAALDEGLEPDHLAEEGDLDEGRPVPTTEELLAHEELALEEEARGQGWRPLAEFRGKAGTWKSARDFVEAGKNYLPFVQKDLRETRAANERMATEMDGLRTEMTQTRADMAKLLDFSRRANQAGYDRAVKDLKAQQREAVAAGDTVTFDKIETQLGEMADARAEADPVPAAPTPRAPAPLPRPKPALETPTEYQDFMTANPWFNSDRVLNAAMIEEHNAVMAESPGMPLADQLEKAKEAVVAQFPKKFGVDPEAPPPPRRPAAPLPPANRRAPAGGRTGIDAIVDPQERAQARAGFQSAKRSMPTITESEFLDIFNDPHADVLDVLKKHKPAK